MADWMLTDNEIEEMANRQHLWNPEPFEVALAQARKLLRHMDEELFEDVESGRFISERRFYEFWQEVMGIEEG